MTARVSDKLERRLARYAEAVRLVDEGEARPQVVEVVTLLRQGVAPLDMPARLGIAKSTVYQRLTDPTDEANQARKRKRTGVCEDCGGPTFNNGSYVLPRHCQKCNGERSHKEAVQRVIAAIRDWHSRYGEVPGAMDWNVPMARMKAHPARLAMILARHEERSWPAVSGVLSVMGSWNEAIQTAGFDSLQPGYRRDPERHKLHLRHPRKELAVKAADLIHRELERTEKRKEKLEEELTALTDEREKLLQAAAIFNGGAKTED